MYKMFIEI